MINTKRVFYIYSYKRGRKGRNVGFVRIRRKEDGYKLNLSIKVPMECTSENMDICLYKRENGDVTGYKVGTMTPFDEICKFHTLINSVKLNKAGFEIDDIEGIYILGEQQDGYVFCAEMENVNKEYREYNEISYVC